MSYSTSSSDVRAQHIDVKIKDVKIKSIFSVLAFDLTLLLGEVMFCEIFFLSRISALLHIM